MRGLIHKKKSKKTNKMSHTKCKLRSSLSLRSFFMALSLPVLGIIFMHHHHLHLSVSSTLNNSDALLIPGVDACSFLVTGYVVRNLTYVNHFMRLRGPDATNHVRIGGYSFVHNLLHMTGERILQPY